MFEVKGKLEISDFYTSYYHHPDKVLSLEVPIKIGHNSGKIIDTELTFTNYSREQLKYKLLLIRFKVPYDLKFRYEIYGYVLVNKIGAPGDLHWQEAMANVKKWLLEQYISMPKTEYTQAFLRDFSLDK